MKRKPLDNGLFRWVLDLDALTDGFLKTAVDANTAIKRSLLDTPDEPGTGPGHRRTGAPSPNAGSTGSGCWRRRR